MAEETFFFSLGVSCNIKEMDEVRDSGTNHQNTGSGRFVIGSRVRAEAPDSAWASRKKTRNDRRKEGDVSPHPSPFITYGRDEGVKLMFVLFHSLNEPFTVMSGMSYGVTSYRICNFSPVVGLTLCHYSASREAAK